MLSTTSASGVRAWRLRLSTPFLRLWARFISFCFLVCYWARHLEVYFSHTRVLLARARSTTHGIVDNPALYHDDTILPLFMAPVALPAAAAAAAAATNVVSWRPGLRSLLGNQKEKGNGDQSHGDCRPQIACAVAHGSYRRRQYQQHEETSRTRPLLIAAAVAEETEGGKRAAAVGFLPSCGVACLPRQMTSRSNSNLRSRNAT